MKIYVASSWSTAYHPKVVKLLREQGHQVYDYRADGPALGEQWNFTKEGVDYQNITALFEIPQAKSTYQKDMLALQEAEAVICLLPSGRSAHIELGYAIGTGKFTYLVWSDPELPDLMHRAVDGVVSTANMVVQLPKLLANPPEATPKQRLHQAPQVAT